MPWKVFSVTVELNFQQESGEKEDWQEILLVFTVLKDEHGGKYGLFLCTAPSLSPQKVLEVYSLRWGIEVYFKEVKQNMGFLSEQTGNYVCHYASVHLAAIRYLMFSHLMMQNCGDKSFSDIKSETMGKIEMLSYASLLWNIFRALIHGVLDNLMASIGESLVKLIKTAIDSSVMDYLEEALQIDKTSQEIGIKAEKMSNKINRYGDLAPGV